MTLAALLPWIVATIAVWMGAFWLWSVVARDASVVDLGWGLGFVLIASLAWWLAGDRSPASWLPVVATALWGVRLSGYLAVRNHGQSEDRRYAAMRAYSPQWFWLRSLVTVFALQGCVMLLVAVPLLTAQTTLARSMAWWNWCGVALFTVGFGVESLADWQLLRFKSRPDSQGRVLQSGLWRYSRHPNYFGETLLWWGLWLTSLALPGAWWTVVSPAAMTLLLLKVSGVTLLERTISNRRPEYAEYRRRTSSFVPWWPRS